MEGLISTLINLILVLQAGFSGASQAQTAKPIPPRQVLNGSLPHVSPDGSRIAFCSNRSGSDDLFVINADGSGEAQLTNTPERESFSGWTADSKHILFSVFKGDASSLYSIDLSGQNQVLITSVPGRSLVISPDGKQLLYASGSWTEMGLFIRPLSGGTPRQVNDGRSIAWNVHWSPDGKRFAFTGRTSTDSELAIFIANADGSNARQVSHVPLQEGAAQWPVWSNDSRQLAIQVNSRAQKNSAHIWLVDLSSGESRKLAAHDTAYVDETPSWFPDGKRLAFQSNRSGRMEVWIINVDGTNPRQLTH